MAKESHKDEMMSCPVAGFFADLGKIYGKKSPFFEHLKNSRVEFLKAIRSLIDVRIDGIEKRGTRGGEKMSKSEAASSSSTKSPGDLLYHGDAEPERFGN